MTSSYQRRMAERREKSLARDEPIYRDLLVGRTIVDIEMQDTGTFGYFFLPMGITLDDGTTLKWKIDNEGLFIDVLVAGKAQGE